MIRRASFRAAGSTAALARVALTLTVFLAVVLLAAGVAACGSADSGATTESPTTTTTSAAALPKLDKITLVAPPGPMAIPMARIAAAGLLADVADKVDVVVWENPDQLKAYVAGGQGDFVTMPSNSSALFYNKGLKLQLLDISVWNITYLITSSGTAAKFADIKGQTLTVPFQGSVPDLMFQYLAKAEGLDPLKDFQLRYATDPTQAAQLLVSGQVDSAVLSEALATAVILQTKATDRPLRRALAFDKAWAAASGGAESPIAGTVATAAMLERPDVIAAFERAYQEAVAWMLANPADAGTLVETALPQLGLKAAPMTASLQNITWKFTPAVDAQTRLDAFYNELAKLSPEVIGGKVPDDGFYFKLTP